MRINFKKLADSAVMPKRARPFDAMFDLVAVSVRHGEHRQIADGIDSHVEYIHTYGTGIAVEIPEGYVGLIFPRSGISKLPIRLANSVGVIDPNYRGEIILKFSGAATSYSVGDRVAQLAVIPLPDVEWKEVSELSPSPDDRGSLGFGSSGS